MNNIFENAYFGKAYRTKDNTIVTFIKQRYEDDFSIYIPKCKYSIETTHRYNSKGEFYLGNGEYGHGALDIVSELQEKINEEELDKLVKNYLQTKVLYRFDEEEQMVIDMIGEAYKAGYRKAKSK